MSDKSSEFRALCGNFSELLKQQQHKEQQQEQHPEEEKRQAASTPMSSSVGVQSSLVDESPSASPAIDEQLKAAAAASEMEMLSWKKRAEESAAREQEVLRELSELRTADVERQKRYDEVCAELEQLKLKLLNATTAPDAQLHQPATSCEIQAAAAPVDATDAPDAAGARFDALDGLDSIPNVFDQTPRPPTVLSASDHQQQEQLLQQQEQQQDKSETIPQAAGVSLSTSQRPSESPPPPPQQHKSLSEVLVCMETLRLALQENVDGRQAADELVRALIVLHDEIEASKPRRPSGSALLSTSFSGSHSHPSQSHHYEQSTVDVVTQALLLLGRFSYPSFDWSTTAQNYSFLSGVSQTRSIASPSAYVSVLSPYCVHVLYIHSSHIYIHTHYLLNEYILALSVQYIKKIFF